MKDETRDRLRRTLLITFIITGAVFTIAYNMIPFVFPDWYDNFISKYTIVFVGKNDFIPRMLFSDFSFWLIVLIPFFPIVMFIAGLFRKVFELRIFNGWAFIFFISSLINSIFWMFREALLRTIYFIKCGDSCSAVSNDLNLIVLFFALIYFGIFAYGFWKLKYRGELTDFMTDIFMFVDQAKAKFKL